MNSQLTTRNGLFWHLQWLISACLVLTCEASAVAQATIADWRPPAPNGYCSPDSDGWAPVSAAMPNRRVDASTVYQGNLIIGGYFTSIGTMPANRIARWDGSAWSALGDGIDNPAGIGNVTSLAVYQGELIAAGYFWTAGDVAAFSIASWDGQAWRSIGQDMFYHPEQHIHSMTVHDGLLVVGGWLRHPGNYSVMGVAAWNGAEWQIFAIDDKPLPNLWVRTLTSYRGKLIAGGEFESIDGTAARDVAVWNGSTWLPLFEPGSSELHITSLHASTVFNDELILAGRVHNSGSGGHLARWDGKQWQLMLSGNWSTYALTMHQNKLFVGGTFTTLPGVPFNAGRIGRWDGSSWSGLDRGINLANSQVLTLSSFRGDLIVGGHFLQADGCSAAYLARWRQPDVLFQNGFEAASP